MAQLVDVDVGRVLVDVRQTAEHVLGRVQHLLQVAVQLVPQSGTQFRVVRVDLVHPLDPANDQHIDRVVQRRHLRYDTIRYDSMYLTCNTKLTGTGSLVASLVYHTEQTKN